MSLAYQSKPNDVYLGAIMYAELKHAGQVRKFSGEPYVNHPVRVAKTLSAYTTDYSILAAAVLHDTLEDTDTTIEDLVRLFGDRVANLVKALTNDPEEIKRVGKTQHLLEKMAKMDDETLLIKLADRLDNVQDVTFDPTSERYEWSQKYADQTQTLLESLETRESPEVSIGCKDLMKKIGEKIYYRSHGY